MEETLHKEGLRQQMLLRALWRDARPGVVTGWLRDAPERSARGLQAYQANAGALAERALAAAYPTLVQLWARPLLRPWRGPCGRHSHRRVVTWRNGAPSCRPSSLRQNN